MLNEKQQQYISLLVDKVITKYVHDLPSRMVGVLDGVLGNAIGMRKEYGKWVPSNDQHVVRDMINMRVKELMCTHVEKIAADTVAMCINDEQFIESITAAAKERYRDTLRSNITKLVQQHAETDANNVVNKIADDLRTFNPTAQYDDIYANQFDTSLGQMIVSKRAKEMVFGLTELHQPVSVNCRRNDQTFDVVHLTILNDVYCRDNACPVRMKCANSRYNTTTERHTPQLLNADGDWYCNRELVGPGDGIYYQEQLSRTDAMQYIEEVNLVPF